METVSDVTDLLRMPGLCRSDRSGLSLPRSQRTGDSDAHLQAPPLKIILKTPLHDTVRKLLIPTVMFFNRTLNYITPLCIVVVVTYIVYTCIFRTIRLQTLQLQ